MPQIEPLRPFQEEDLPFFLHEAPKSLMLYEPRLGKTVEVCNILPRDPNCKRILIACSKNAFLTWIEHLPLWYKHLAPDLDIEIRIIRGKHSNAAAQRHKTWTHPITRTVTIYLVTFEALLGDDQFLLDNHVYFDTVIGDEVHRKLRGRKTKTTTQFRRLVRQANRFHALSGTLAGKWGPGDYWNLLNIIDHKIFGSYWHFVNTFCYLIENQWGKQILPGVRNESTWKKLLSRYARVRLREIVAPQMPKIQRDLIHVEMNKEQAELYKVLGKEMFAFTPEGGIIVAANSLEKNTRKRQILTCPKILDSTLGVGGAMEDLTQRLLEAKEEEDVFGYHVVIFSAFRAALSHFQDHLRSAGFQYVDILSGGAEPEDVAAITDRFRRNRGIILCTTSFAQAFSLVPAQQCFHIGYDYDPNNNKQAEDRLIPQQGQNPINSWYYAYKETDDDLLAYNINIKSQVIHYTTAPLVQNQGTE